MAVPEDRFSGMPTESLLQGFLQVFQEDKPMKTSHITKMTVRCGACGTTVTFPLAAGPLRDYRCPTCGAELSGGVDRAATGYNRAAAASMRQDKRTVPASSISLAGPVPASPAPSAWPGPRNGNSPDPAPGRSSGTGLPPLAAAPPAPAAAREGAACPPPRPLFP